MSLAFYKSVVCYYGWTLSCLPDGSDFVTKEMCNSIVESLMCHNQRGESEHFAKRSIGEVIQLASCCNSYRVVAESLV